VKETAAPVIVGMAVGIIFIILIALAMYSSPIPPNMRIVVNGTQFNAGIGSIYGTLMNGNDYSVEVDPSQNLPEATINGSRGLDIHFIANSLDKPELVESWIFDAVANNRIDLKKLNSTHFEIPEYALQGEYILTVAVNWGEDRLVSGASYHHKIRISSLERIPSPEEISDVELVNKTLGLDEVKVIFTVYPNPHVSVDRSQNFGVEYNISTSQIQGTPYDNSKVCLSIKIRMDSDGYPAFLLDNGGTRWELGDERQIEFLQNGGGCIFTLINAISDTVAIAKTKELEEVKSFLTKYPSATLGTNRQAIIEITYGITKAQVTGVPWTYEGVPESSVALRLQVNKDLDIIWLVLECTVQLGTSGSADVYEFTEDIVRYLQKDMHCWDDPSLKQPFDS
jgi:hypothetical protein